MIDEFDLDGDGESNAIYFFELNHHYSFILVNFDEFLAMLNSD
jgi:hypothetical protein